ncbi:MAG: hypothetical protein ACERKO_10580 [Acetanaerobacterium sp.]
MNPLAEAIKIELARMIDGTLLPRADKLETVMLYINYTSPTGGTASVHLAIDPENITRHLKGAPA